jgi:hypothetical protein
MPKPVIDQARMLKITSAALAELATRTGTYLRDRGLDLRLARGLDEQALAMYQRLADRRSASDR